MATSLRSLLPARFRSDQPVIPVIRLSGAIGASSGGLRSASLSLAGVEAALAKAFSVKRAPAVALVINSPGGAAVQSHLIFKRIRALAEEKGKKVIVAVEDVAASGGYMIAVAGDEIVVDASSIVGSIGVLFSGFGFTQLIEKIGVERRVHTAGKSKAMLDPFRPEKAEDVARLMSLQEDVHAGFIALVKSRRPSLRDDPDLFTGAFWSGSRAVELGLADRVGDLRSLLRERYGEKVRVLPIATAKRGWLRRLGGGGSTALPDGAASGLIERAIATIEERLLWSRFGL
jgi:signal peptide peptidase SppA